MKSASAPALERPRHFVATHDPLDAPSSQRPGVGRSIARKTGRFDEDSRRAASARRMLGTEARPPLPARRDGDVQMWRRSRVKSLLALATASSLLLQGPLAAASPQQAAPAKATAAPPPLDGGWPRTYATPSGGQLVLYQPQVASWDRQLHMVAYAAVSFLPPGAEKAQL